MGSESCRAFGLRWYFSGLLTECAGPFCMEVHLVLWTTFCLRYGFSSKGLRVPGQGSEDGKGLCEAQR